MTTPRGTSINPDPRTRESLAMLRKAIGVAQDLAHDLTETSAPTAYGAVVEALTDAYDRARDLARPVGRTGCDRHPGGPVEENPPPGWSPCLLCNTHRRRADRPEHTGQADAAREAGNLPAPRPYASPNPEYVKAAARLSYMADLGGASLEAARHQLGQAARYEDLVLHAAANPVTPTGNGAERNTTERPGTDAPTCECGTALDPDGTCLTCTTTERP